MNDLKNRILFLTLRTFSLTGGIEKVCRTMARALSDLTMDAGLKMLSMYDRNEDLDHRYIREENFLAFSKNKFRFLSAALIKGIWAEKVILSHINLLAIGLLIKKISPKTEIILLAHGIEVWGELNSWKKNFLRKGCQVWAVSHYTAGIMKDKHAIPSKNIHVLNNALDPFFKIPKIKERPDALVYKHGIFESDPILFTLTRLSSSELYKGYDLVLHTLPEVIQVYPTLLYFIAGKADSEEQERLEKLIEELNLQNNVILLGCIPDSKVSSYYQLADIFIMPSRKEGFGLVFIEAAACGSKIIAGNLDGSRDALLNGKLGTLVDPIDREKIKEAILLNLANRQNENFGKAIQSLCLGLFG